MPRTVLGSILTAALVAGAALPTAASAGQCDSYVRQTTSVSGERVVSLYREMLSCNQDEAEAGFDEFMRAAGSVGSIVDLSLVAIDAGVYTPVWNMMEKIPDYEARDEIAKGVGVNCDEHPQVLPFLQGAYYGLRDIQFQQWDDAFITCGSEDLVEWTESVVVNPPASVYDEKYNTITTVYAKHRKVAALPVLERAAIDAANRGGPFNAVIEKMDQAVQPEGIGERMTDESRAALESSLVAVAQTVGPEQAALVADHLYNAGAEEAAASLLPRVYPDRVQDGGRMLYGAASIETCDGKAVLHVLEVTEPARRWSILADLEEPLRAFKPRLHCTTDGPWPIVATPEPVADSSAVSAWADELVAQWEARELDVKTRSERTLELE